MKKFTKIALIVASFVLVAALSVGGTLAWLSAKTEIVTNTFSSTDINIDLFEHEYVYNQVTDDDDNVLGTVNTTETKKVENYKMVPGTILPKDPTLRVEAKSEDCYIFVEVWDVNNENIFTTEEDDKIISFTPSAEWVKLANEKGVNGGDVYYYAGPVEGRTATDEIVEYSESVQEFEFLANNRVSVAEELTKDYMDKVEAGTTPKPVLNFFGYAVQAQGMANAAAAWTASGFEYVPSN